jgi:hypothetical protein
MQQRVRALQGLERNKQSHYWLLQGKRCFVVLKPTIRNLPATLPCATSTNSACGASKAEHCFGCLQLTSISSLSSLHLLLLSFSFRSLAQNWLRRVGITLQFFAIEKNWTGAAAYCAEEGGALAPARNEKEQTHLYSLNSQQLFWIAGNSLATSGRWLWGEPYTRPVTFTGLWTNRSSIVHTLPRGFGESRLSNMVLLNGYRGAYAWKIQDGADQHAFICRTAACESGTVPNMVEGKDTCEVPPPGPAPPSKVWIVGPILGSIFVILVVTLLLGKKYDADWYKKLVKCFTRKHKVTSDTFGLQGGRLSLANSRGDESRPSFRKDSGSGAAWGADFLANTAPSNEHMINNTKSSRLTMHVSAMPTPTTVAKRGSGGIPVAAIGPGAATNADIETLFNQSVGGATNGRHVDHFDSSNRPITPIEYQQVDFSEEPTLHPFVNHPLKQPSFRAPDPVLSLTTTSTAISAMTRNDHSGVEEIRPYSTGRAIKRNNSKELQSQLREARKPSPIKARSGGAGTAFLPAQHEKGI